MNYKKVIKSRELRIRLMRMLSFVPDTAMVKIQYRIKTGRRLHLNAPFRYTEKLQWYKLYYRDPLMALCADKYAVRSYVKKQGYAHILNELYGVYDKPEEIDFEQLPERFVLKDTLGGGGNSVIICRDKSKLDISGAIEKMTQWIRQSCGKHPGREWVYDQGKNKIVAEKYIPSDPNTGGLIDYKFFCFQGRAEYLYGIADREFGAEAGVGIFTREFEQLPYLRQDEKPLTQKLKKPENYIELLACAEKLSEPFPHARIDLYDQNGSIIFGEITFFDGSGYMKFEPDAFDFIMGREFMLPAKNV